LLRFLKKSQKTPKYERDSCMPGPKNGERPYLAVPETPFLGVVFGHFPAPTYSFPILFCRNPTPAPNRTHLLYTTQPLTNVWATTLTSLSQS